MIDAAGGLPAVALRFVAVAATTGALGAWAFSRFVLPRLSTSINDADRQSWWTLATRTAIWCSVTLAVSAGARTLVPGSVLPRVADGTENLLRSIMSAEGLHAQGVVAGLAAVLLAFRTRRGHPWSLDAESSVIAMALIQPALAHAGVTPGLQVLAYAVDIAHGAAAGAWVGALALVTVLVRQHRARPDGAARSMALFTAFHPVALVSAPTVFVTGLATAWLRMGAPEGIANSTYSGLFVAKLLLAGVVGYFGAGHSKLVVRRAATVAVDSVSRTLLLECAFAIAVLFVTAILVGTPPIG
jgi:putative copper export protein